MKPRLLFVIHSLRLGGAERLVVQIAQAIKDEYEIGILCLDSKGELWSECLEEGFSLFCTERKEGIRFENLYRVAKAVKQFGPDVIHAHQYTPVFYAALTKLFYYRATKLIFTEHGRHHPDLVSKKRRLANSILFKSVDAFTGVSKFTCEAMQKREGVRAPIDLIYNGICEKPLENIEQKSIAAELSLEADAKIVAFVGTLRDVKNPLILIKAFAKVASTSPKARLVYIGDGPLRADLVREIERVGLGDKVFLLGARNPATPYFKEIDVFVLPSKQEAASLAVLEAMYFALPILVSSGGGSPELITHEKTGLVFNAESEDELASSLSRMLTKGDESRMLAENARREVIERFSFATMLSKYRTLYERLISAGNS